MLRLRFFILRIYLVIQMFITQFAFELSYRLFYKVKIKRLTKKRKFTIDLFEKYCAKTFKTMETF